MRPIWIDAAYSCALLALAGCATYKQPILPHGDKTMLNIWERQTDTPHYAGVSRVLEARQTLRRPLADDESNSTEPAYARYTRDASNEIRRLFRRLPDPDLVMYVFPHLSGTEPVPVPGYSTVFPFYQRVQYAMPGERVESD